MRTSTMIGTRVDTKVLQVMVTQGFEFDDDVDFASPFLRGMLSDQQ